MSELTPQEAERLFQEVSKATREDDSVKLSELMSTEATPEVAPVEAPPADEEPAEDDNTETPTEEVTPEVKPDEGDSPPEEADETVQKDETKPEPTELEKLKEQLDKLTKENHSLRSQAGRVPHVQRRIKELDRKLEELTKHTTSPSSQPSAKLQPKILKALEGIKETDPDLADTIAKVIAEATDGVAEDITTRERELLTAERAETYKAYQEEQAAELLELYPNAPQVFQSPQWKQWKAEQSPQVAALASSDTARDVAFAFEKYAKDMVAKYPELVKSSSDEVKPAVTPAVQSEEAKRIEAERLRKKQNTPNVSNPSAPGKVSLPDDRQALFEKFSEQIRKEISGK